MTISDFLSQHGSKMGYLETTFLKYVFYADYGEVGLDLIVPEVNIPRNDGTGKNWRLDFVVTTPTNKFAIECDGFSYHAAGMVSKERFDELERKRNETIRQGYILVSLSRDQIENNAQEAIYELRRSFNSDKELFSIFLKRNTGRIEPHDVQQQALNALNETRKAGNVRGLVSLATGLGKTYLGIFDTQAMESERILFIVHVEHILKQAKNSFESVVPTRAVEMGFFTGKEKSHEGKNIIFSTVQTISREKNLTQFAPDYFDYVIIDESHHTAAESYKKVAEYFQPKFFLGLTATPDRMDKKDVLEYYGNNLVFEMSQTEAIKQGYLANLEYRGFKDNVDYSEIYYNGFRYDINDLNKSLMIEKRDRAVIDKFKELAHNKKTIAFCVSIDHAEWSAQKFREAGYDAIAIHSKIEDKNTAGAYQSAGEIIEAFDKGKHQIVFVVDMLNEGIDIPDVECLLMLRPTESSTILTQQIGRGLRIAHNKSGVLVLDFIGNYKSSPQILPALGIHDVGELKEDRDKGVFYYDNNGRHVEFDSEVIDIFRYMVSRSTREVQEDLISEEWDAYADYLAENTKAGTNLYWSIGKKNNDISLQLWGLKFLDLNKEKYPLNEDLSNALQKESGVVSPDATMEGIRALFFSKLIGLIVETKPVTFSEAYLSIKDLDTNDLRVKEVISNQIEKFYFFNDISNLVNRHAEDGERRKVDELFHIYPIFFIYQLVLLLRDYGYEDNRLTKFEIDHFVALARNHDEVKEVAERIVRYRQYDDKYELEKLLKQKSTMDTRIYKILSNVSSFSFSPESIQIPMDKLADLESKVSKFVELHDSNKLVTFSKENPATYRNMLYSSKSLLEYHT
jgi:superfamily II DNA or RNA helicase